MTNYVMISVSESHYDDYRYADCHYIVVVKCHYAESHDD
jgi:hypothetical protein